MARRVALTIDTEHPDRPTRPGVIESILDLLDREAVPAFCFIQGRWALAYPHLAARIATAGHGIGSHAHHHVPVPMLSAAGLRQEIGDSTDAVRDATGIDPRPWFRCPFGAGADHPRTTSGARRSGLRPVGAVGRRCARLGRRDARARWRTVSWTGCWRPRRDAIVLLHSWPAPTLGALPGIVRRLRDAGAGLVPLAAIVGSPTGQRPGRAPPRS